MTFQTDKTDTFKALFEGQKDKIRQSQGCLHLELWQDTVDTNIFFTYSCRTDEAALANYRNSSFFNYRNSSFFIQTWRQTRQMFAAKAEAWSADRIAALP